MRAASIEKSKLWATGGTLIKAHKNTTSKTSELTVDICLMHQ